ncbi:Uu.00g087150.m01.CDS01 [Anthostomella pinea]|uniref:Uu.00g087150.m01.CDS01 n=1 Tax=Anthostomella pinea TaxID=933095 RepID=A0AAI8YHJ8_9PEZI|nr:Uu.00g087150.m01.CDS01 [Anthostomella pinea]
MASSIPSGVPWADRVSVTAMDMGIRPYLIPLFVCVLACYYLFGTKSSEFELINPRKPFQFTDVEAKKHFQTHAKRLIHKALDAAHGKPYRAITEIGETIVLPNKYAQEVRNIPELSFDSAIRHEFHTHLSTFETFRAGTNGQQLVRFVAQRQLTQKLGHVTQPLSDECTATLQDLLGDSKEWHEIQLKDTMLMLVARISSRVFLGEELCRNPEWLKITIDHTVSLFTSARQLRVYPYLLRPIAQMFLPLARDTRQQVRDARRVIQPVLDKRRATKAAMIAEGKDPKELNDAMEWFEQTAKGQPYDPALMQLNLSTAAIHTTTDLIMKVLADIIAHPDIIEPLRKEMAEVIGRDGWKKTSLYNLKLLDSVVKETQRVKPVAIASIRRYIEKDTKLSDGTVLPKGNFIIVSAEKMWDPEVYSDPQEWDPYRFLKIRQDPGNESWAQLASTSPEHMGFGHGQHACPGRFFAANEVKVALVHLLMKYDFKFSEAGEPKVFPYGWSIVADPRARLMVKRRQEEIEL